jgi:hypothetical protein
MSSKDEQLYVGDGVVSCAVVRRRVMDNCW